KTRNPWPFSCSPSYIVIHVACATVSACQHGFSAFPRFMGHHSKKAGTARRHERVRQQHSDELAEDYVEAIHALRKESGIARVVDLTKIFGVSHVSVIRALARMEK